MFKSTLHLFLVASILLYTDISTVLAQSQSFMTMGNNVRQHILQIDLTLLEGEGKIVFRDQKSLYNVVGLSLKLPKQNMILKTTSSKTVSPHVRTYIDDENNHITVGGAGAYGAVSLNGERWAFETIKYGQVLLTSFKDNQFSTWEKATRCQILSGGELYFDTFGEPTGTIGIDMSSRQEDPSRSSPNPGECIMISFGLSLDYGIYQVHGSVAAATAYANSIVTELNVQYATVFNASIQFSLVELHIADTPAHPYEQAVANCSTINDYLQATRVYQANNFNTHDLGQGIVSRNMPNILGVAELAGICTNTLHYSTIRGNTPLSVTMETSIHEIGHNFGAGHVSAAGYYMSQGSLATNGWHPATISAVNAHTNTFACSDGPYELTGSPNTNFLLPARTCLNEPLLLLSTTGRNPLTYQWSMPGGVPSSASGFQNAATQYPTAGNKDVTLVTSNSECGGVSVSRTKTISVIQQQQGPLLCRPTLSNLGTSGSNANAGITQVAFGTVDNYSGTSFTTRLAYEDFACEHFSFVPGTVVNFAARLPLPNAQELRVFLDWNRNGTFELPAELMFIGNNSSGEFITGSFPMPPAAVRNELLRIRFSADFANRNTTGCVTPLIGQVEDYGIVLPFVPLPAELVAFEAAALNATDVEVRWETASEVGVEAFAIEHSTSGKNFEPVGELDALGSPTLSQMYSFEHTGLLPGAHYYRLVTQDLDGAVEYSDVVAVELAASFDRITYFPNPAYEVISFHAESIEASEAFIFCDMVGREWTIVSSDSRLDVRQLPRGLYSVRPRASSASMVTRIMLK